jgi:hypothetical protein
MLKEHSKVTLKTIDGTEIVRYFPGPQGLDLEIGATLVPENPALGAALHKEGYFHWSGNFIAKRSEDGIGILIMDYKRVMEAEF